MAKQKFLTKEVAKGLPKLYTTEEQGDEAKVAVKFFCPWNNWTWYATEASAILEDGTEVAVAEVKDLVKLTGVEDIRFFGLVKGQETELGYFSMREMQSVKGPWGLFIERDMYFGSHTLGDVRSGKAR